MVLRRFSGFFDAHDSRDKSQKNSESLMANPRGIAANIAKLRSTPRSTLN
jgi:hypothetical protein